MLEDFVDELVEPVHGGTDVGEGFVLVELVAAKVLGGGGHGDHGHVPEGRVARDGRQRAVRNDKLIGNNHAQFT